jgi:hypothetical protein
MKAGARWNVPKRQVEVLATTRQCRVIRRPKIELHEHEERREEALGLTKRQMEEKTQRQGGFDREIRVFPLRPPRARSVRFPGGDGRRGQPDGDIASTDQGSIVGGPVPDVVFRFVRGMNSRFHPSRLVCPLETSHRIRAPTPFLCGRGSVSPWRREAARRQKVVSSGRSRRGWGRFGRAIRGQRGPWPETYPEEPQQPRSPWSGVFLLAASAVVMTVGGASAAETPAGPAGSPDSEIALPGEIWTTIPLSQDQSQVAPFTIREMAHRAAPVLGFSAGEPAVVDSAPAPASVNWPSTTGRRGYYVLRKIRLAEPLPRDQRPFVHDIDAVWSNAPAALPITLLEGITLRYLFYYPRDYGFGRGASSANRVGGHRHDIEAVEIRLALRPIRRFGKNGIAVRIESVAGSAHGSGWYTNELVVDESIVLPVRVLVEEGKHSTSPDRDGDGRYAPGYDVNRHTRDAWGIRDHYDLEVPPGLGQIVAKFVRISQFRDYMATPRRKSDQVWPGGIDRPDHAVATYDLVWAGAGSQLCRELTLTAGVVRTARFPDVPARRRLTRVLRAKGICGAMSLAMDSRPSLFKRITGSAYSKPFQQISDKVGVAIHFDDGPRITAAVPLRDLPGVGGWLLLRGHWSGTKAGLALEYQPSATRLAEWYIASGVVPSITAEGGIKIRLPLSPLPMLTARLGLAADAGQPHNLRLVGGFGLGPW